MAKNHTNAKRGFTIIEVVLVLAIAGLIFLMVFIALPNMQRSQRDTQRRQDYAALSSNITNFTTNNNGRLPTASTDLDASVYINTSGEDPSGSAYDLAVVALSSAKDAITELTPMTNGSSPEVRVYTHADCEGTATSSSIAGSAKPKYNSSSRAFAIYAQLETGTYCQAGS